MILRPFVFVLLAAATGCQHREAAESSPQPVEVRCVHPHRGSIERRLTLRGRLAPPPGGSLSVAPQVPGRVVEVTAREGERVSAGQIVAVVDDVPSRDALRQADAVVAQAKAVDTNAAAALDRTQALVHRGIAARQELEDARAKAEAAKAQVAAAVAAEDLARRTLGRVQVRANLDGVVTRVLRGPGALVDGTAATPVLELAASAAVEFVAAVPQLDLASVTLGAAASGSLLGDGGALAGTVRALPSALDPVTGFGAVRIALDSASGSAAVGSYGIMTISAERHDDALLLPAAALRGAVADGAEIVLCKGNKAEVTRIEVGLYDKSEVEVLGGAEEKDAVAVDHVLGLETDSPIREAP